jgi:hypothetical protein
MKNFKCIKCNDELDSVELGIFKKRISYDCKEKDDHYFRLDLDCINYIDNFESYKITELSYFNYDSTGFPIYYLEIIFHLNEYQYYFKNKSKQKQILVLDDFILNKLYEKHENNKLTVNCIEGVISKLENLVIFL